MLTSIIGKLIFNHTGKNVVHSIKRPLSLKFYRREVSTLSITGLAGCNGMHHFEGLNIQ